MQMTREELFEKTRDVLAQNFEIDPTSITLDSNMFEDLDLDSIDAVDLVITLQETTGKRLRAEDFKSVRTVGDVVETLHRLQEAGE